MKTLLVKVRKQLLPAVTAFMTLAAAFGVRAGSPSEHSFYSDSLALRGEVSVIPAGDLADYNINTFDDILEIAPGVSYLRYGPPGSRTLFSMEARGHGRALLMVNGRPMTNIYTAEPLVKYVDLSRIVRIEIIHGGSPSLTGGLSSEGAVNIVLERGGREAPHSQADFTYGDDNRRARRIWFSSPRSYVTGTLVYNEYLQDDMEALIFDPSRSIGYCDTRILSTEITFGRDYEKSGFIHLSRFEDTYRRTACSSSENISSSGFDAFMKYRYGGLNLYARQFGYQRKRLSGEISGLRSEIAVRLDGSLGSIGIRTYVRGTRDLFENRFVDTESDPEIQNYHGGIVLATPPWKEVFARASVHGGYHGEAGLYSGGELGVSRGGAEDGYETLVFSRKARIPSPSELFSPAAGTPLECFDYDYTGSADLEPSFSDEISLEKYFAAGLRIRAFFRRERSRIKSCGSRPLANDEEERDLYGMRAGYRREGEFWGMKTGFSLNGEYYHDREDLPDGVPQYRFLGGLYLKIPVFDRSETLTIRLDSIETGARRWGTTKLDAAAVQNLSASITLMSSIIRFQVKNFLDYEYQTVPGYRMGERHIRIGIEWNLVN